MFSPFDDAFDSLSFQSGRSYLNFFWPHRLILAGGRPNGPETRISIRNRGNNRRRQMKLLSVISTSAFDGVLRVFASNAFLLMEGTRKTNLTTRKERKKEKEKKNTGQQQTTSTGASPGDEWVNEVSPLLFLAPSQSLQVAAPKRRDATKHLAAKKVTSKASLYRRRPPQSSAVSA